MQLLGQPFQKALKSLLRALCLLGKSFHKALGQQSLLRALQLLGESPEG